MLAWLSGSLCANVTENTQKYRFARNWLRRTVDGHRSVWSARHKKKAGTQPAFGPPERRHFCSGTITTGAAVWGWMVTLSAPAGTTTVSTSRSTPPPATLPLVSP
jgi:hypothetical protein